MITNLKKAANGKWRGILSAFIEPELLDGKHHACPLCAKESGDGGKDRFRFDNKRGDGTYFCSVCGAGNGIMLLARHEGVTVSDAWKIVEKLLPTCETEAPVKKTDYAPLIKRLIESSTAIMEGDDVSTYLHRRLGKDFKIPPSIRQCKFADYADPLKPVYNTMLCRVQDVEGRLVGIHLTMLKNGLKAPIPQPRRLLSLYEGATVGAAIRLYPARPDAPLTVGEGVETSFSAGLLWKCPAWATINSALMGQLELPANIMKLVIAGDNDEKFGGQAAAYKLAYRMAIKGKQVRVRIPTETGTDWNDRLNFYLNCQSNSAETLGEGE